MKIAYFSSYPPKACGIATYALALRKTIKDRDHSIEDFVVAIDDREQGYSYGSSVKFHFWDKDGTSYQTAAEFINNSDANIVDIQHEFGLYGEKVNTETVGNNNGENFLIFLRALKKPVVTTLHMVYRKPPKKHISVVKEICDRSNKVVVLAHIAKKFLTEKYDINPDKIVVIPHGAPNVPKYATAFFKEMLGFDKKEILISSFGLIRPKKGYEYLIEAMAEVKKRFPNAKLLLAGRAHPQKSPEYYQILKDKVKELRLKDSVKFVNKFVNYPDLINYLMATNIFVAPFLVMEQVSSGTLLYAMGAGRACVSTPFDYAKEALANNRGILVPPEDASKIAEAIIRLIDHPKIRHRMQNESYKYARQQIWSKTSKQYVSLFKEIIS
ncbi:hypothetical protein COT78_02265 [Candidatus Berkelbacteria bacterium CG10_big_fil_rev_8_21_14_0_10_43_13]|uniref:Glycosyl transferase family 1 domain-containing protein n=1 Tax=Candidatus Berkelbacteria bacterium CG10_big_fil_rev_8_21_14_0_10_43_13 TaxID=1974514 RepID=A0A2H0W6H7_9BACT|nr:MAG: hypothetical protein COT78_02265 [Candidatus Berkelbacteria bacterium CG10_big_fil_rev_8_21_14_0_10_43_13]